MRALFVLIVAALLSACTTAPSVNANWREEGYEREGQAIADKVTAEQITRVDGLRRMQAVAKSYFPNDTLLLGVWVDLTEYAEKLERGDISKEAYVELFNARWDLYNNVNRQRHAEIAAQESRQRRAEFMSNFFGNMARSMQRNNPPVINCATTSMPGVLTTSCR